MITRRVSGDTYRTIYQYQYNGKYRLVMTLHSDEYKPAITANMIRENPRKFHNTCYTSR